MKYVRRLILRIFLLTIPVTGCTCLRACDQGPHTREGALTIFPLPIRYALTILSQFGDGIMSMIDCKINLDRKPDPKGDRVVLTFE